MTRKLRVRAEVTVSAPLEKVWEYSMDISKIPEFHPRVNKVDFISGKTMREVGVSYQCNIIEASGKGTCVEKVTEVVPMEKFTTTIPEDSWGLSKLFENYVVDTLFTKINENSTKMEIRQYYETNGIKAKIINLFARKKITHQTLDTLNGIKKMIEKEYASN
jgi:uncharacterized membrane protein